MYAYACRYGLFLKIYKKYAYGYTATQELIQDPICGNGVQAEYIFIQLKIHQNHVQKHDKISVN